MDIVRFKGGLGNQMFQYAFVEALRSRGRDVGCSLGYYRNNPDMMPFVLDKVFPNIELNEVVDDVFNAIDERWKKIKDDSVKLAEYKKNVQQQFFWVEENPYVFCPEVFETNNVAFVGYWQSEKYFRDIREKIVNRFKFAVADKGLKEYERKIEEGYISVHVRRKDYLDYAWLNICSEQYYKKAMLKMRQLIPNAKFIVFSDDVEWARKNLIQDDIEVCISDNFENYEDWYDMYLMSKCKGNIIANSSFSWWGAWLNDVPGKIVIAPNMWRTNGKAPDVLCNDWRRINIL